MRPLTQQAQTGWRQRDWRSCKDFTSGEYAGTPRWLRCMRCYRLVTHGQIQFGGCACGFRKLNPCLELTTPEMLLLKLGWFPMVEFEREAVRPFLPFLATSLRPRLLRIA